MKKMNGILLKLAQFTASSALVVGLCSVNSACHGWIHQPQMPEKMAAMRKTK